MRYYWYGDLQLEQSNFCTAPCLMCSMRAETTHWLGHKHHPTRWEWNMRENSNVSSHEISSSLSIEYIYIYYVLNHRSIQVYPQLVFLSISLWLWLIRSPGRPAVTMALHHVHIAINSHQTSPGRLGAMHAMIKGWHDMTPSEST